jgi:uncharacterized protein YciI
MQFIVIAYDGTDAGALERRSAARDAHLRSAQDLYERGRWLYAAGILGDDGVPVGSMMVCDFPSRAHLEEEWLQNEPYVVGRVWEKVAVNRAQIAPFLPQ